jgi:uncharacterized protein (TIGR02118 family)
MMIKRISLVARKPGMSIEEFERHWTGPHIEIVRQLPGLRGLRLNLIEHVESEREWDGIGELWFDSVQDAQAAFAADPVRSLLAEDRAKFLGRGQVYFVREETVIAPGGEEVHS